MDFSLIDKYIDDNTENLIQDLALLVAVPSKCKEPSEGKPFGEECAEALGVTERLADAIGLDCRNCENYMLECDYNGEETALGVITHLDVVPEGDGWDTNPFELVRRGDALYGRGVIDDKGPAAAVLCAVRALKENNVMLSKNVRLLFGSDEETSMRDLEYYRSKKPLPKYMLSPDGDFPVINVEKGICQIKFKKKYEDKGSLSALTAGRVINAVPDRAEAVISGVSCAEAQRAAERAAVTVKCEAVPCGDGVRISAAGVSAHGSTPEKGDNALTGLMKIILSMNLERNELLSAVEELYALFPYGEGDGRHAGLEMRDEESGSLSALLSLFDAKGGNLTGGIDIRFPASIELETVRKTVKEKLLPSGFELDFPHNMEGHIVPSDSDFVKTLLECYSDVTKRKGSCIAEGGATYLHTVDGGVAYGAQMPGEENNMHGANEHVNIKTLTDTAKIYARAIYRLCR